MKIFNDVRSRSPLGEVGQKPVDTPLLAAGSRAFERIVFICGRDYENRATLKVSLGTYKGPRQ